MLVAFHHNLSVEIQQDVKSFSVILNSLEQFVTYLIIDLWKVCGRMEGYNITRFYFAYFYVS